MITTVITIVAAAIIAHLVIVGLFYVSLPVLKNSWAFLNQLALDLIKIWKAVHKAKLDVAKEQMQAEANEQELFR